MHVSYRFQLVANHSVGLRQPASASAHNSEGLADYRPALLMPRMGLRKGNGKGNFQLLGRLQKYPTIARNCATFAEGIVVDELGQVQATLKPTLKDTVK